MSGLLTGIVLGVAVLLATGESPSRSRSPRGRLPVLHGLVRGRAPRVRRGTAGGPDVPLVLDLVAAAVRAGLPPGRALEATLDALSAAGVPEDPALRRVAVQLSWGSTAEAAWSPLTAQTDRWDDLADALLLSTRTGAPAASLLASAASSARATRRWNAEAAATRLSALLVLPLGLCTLPAFLLLGVVPVVLTLAGEVLGAGS